MAASSLIRGHDVKRLMDRLRPKIEEESRRLLAKGRELSIQMGEYIDVQASHAVRESLARLLAGRKWRFVKFSEFVESLGRLVDRLFRKLGIIPAREVEAAPVCFVVDSLRKSSFWVVAMALLLCPPATYTGLSIAVDDDGDGAGLFDAFRKLPQGTRLVLMDDATYSGDQLSHFHDMVVETWRHSHANGHSPKTYVAVPFMSTGSVALFSKRVKDKKTVGRPTDVTLLPDRLPDRLLHGEQFSSMFYRRTLSHVLASDLFLVCGSPTLTEYRSFYFDVLGLLPTNSMFVFEHKVADSLSIPNLWLKVGPCVPASVRHAYRVHPGRADALARAVRSDLVHGDMMLSLGPGTPAQRQLFAAVQRVLGLLHSPRFRSEYMERVSLAPDVGRAPTPAFLPLIPIEFCDPKYREYVRRRRRARAQGGKKGDLDENLPYDVPPCRRPPYQRPSFRRKLFSSGSLP
jgi:hypothetical protein